MFALAGLLLLVANGGLATAIDINAFRSGDCSGSAYATCSNIGNLNCCKIVVNNDGAHSAKWYHLSGSKGLQSWQEANENLCGSLLKSRVVSGIDTSCMGAYPNALEASGLSWYQPSSKRGEVEGPVACENTVWPDIVRVNDVEYCTTGLDTEDIDELLGQAINSTDTTAVHKKYAGFACKK